MAEIRTLHSQSDAPRGTPDFPYFFPRILIIFIFLFQVARYQQKLKLLDGKQQELVKDNCELKDLCLYLDEERNFADVSCPHCGVKIMSRPSSVVPADDEEQDVVGKGEFN